MANYSSGFLTYIQYRYFMITAEFLARSLFFMRLSCYWLTSWIYSYFDNIMTQFMINEMTNARENEVNLLSSRCTFNVQEERKGLDSYGKQGLRRDHTPPVGGGGLSSVLFNSFRFIFVPSSAREPVHTLWRRGSNFLFSRMRYPIYADWRS